MNSEQRFLPASFPCFECFGGAAAEEVALHERFGRNRGSVHVVGRRGDERLAVGEKGGQVRVTTQRPPHFTQLNQQTRVRQFPWCKMESLAIETHVETDGLQGGIRVLEVVGPLVEKGPVGVEHREKLK